MDPVNRTSSDAGYILEVDNPEQSHDEVFALCERVLPGFSRAHYSKYYEQNPSGHPVVVVARDTRRGEAIGVAALHPHQLSVEGSAWLGAVAGDFALDPAHRGFGPALAMQRRLLESLPAKGWGFSYGLPNRAAAGVLMRAGYRPLDPVVRFVRPVGPREGLAVLRARSGATNRSLVEASRPWSLRRAARRHAVEHPARFDERFVDLWHQAAKRAAYVPLRTPELMNWKFDTAAGTPQRFEITTVSLRGELAGSSVAYEAHGVRHLADAVWRDRESLRALLAADVLAARKARLAAVDILLMSPAPDLVEALESLGFFRSADLAPPAPLVYLPPGEGRASASFADAGSWSLLEGAIDL